MTDRPVRKFAERPFRLWDPRLKRNIPRRYFADPQHAHDRALSLVRWERVGTIIEVYTARNGRLLGVYRRVQGGVTFQLLHKDW